MVVARWRWALVILTLGAVMACGDEPSGDGASMAGANALAPVGTDLDADIFFSPAYSSFDGVHTFQVPMTVKGYSAIEWETENKDLVDLEKINPNTVMITTRKAGTARIIARAGSLSGSTMLHITESTDADWNLGKERYTNAAVLMIDRQMAMMQAMQGGMMITIPDDLSCKNCHGSGAMALSVEHTPQQTGGYSDEELVNIFTKGAKPPTAGWKSGIPMQLYMSLHTWSATEEEKRGLVAYIRSLTPATQGQIDFGGIAGDND
jgi:hypothetical protein